MLSVNRRPITPTCLHIFAAFQNDGLEASFYQM